MSLMIKIDKEKNYRLYVKKIELFQAKRLDTEVNHPEGLHQSKRLHFLRSFSRGSTTLRPEMWDSEDI